MTQPTMALLDYLRKQGMGLDAGFLREEVEDYMSGLRFPTLSPFEAYIPQNDPDLCFVLMAFLPDMDEIYQNVVKPVIAEAPIGMKCLRADEIYSTNEIMQDVWRSVLSARIVIADLTHRNPNVMYELGLSHAIGKKTILLTQDMDDVPFDLRYIRHIVYDREPRGITKLRHALSQTMQTILSEPVHESYRVAEELAEAQRLRKENQELLRKVEQLERQRILKGRDDFEPFEQLAAGAHDIFISGPTLAIVVMKQDLFRQKAESGCHLRFVIPDPDPSSVAMRGLIQHWHTPSEGFLSEVKSALVNFRILKQSVSSEAAKLIEIRYVDWALTLSLLMIDGDSKDGYLQVELLPFNASSADRPHFALRAAEGTRWFSFFKTRCDQLWNKAQVLDVDVLPLIQ